MSKKLCARCSSGLLAAFILVAGLACSPALAVGPFVVEEVNPDSDVDPILGGGRNTSTGGRSNNIAIDPGNNDVLYAATEWGGLYKSTDGGDNWIRLDGHLPTAAWDVLVDPGNTGTVYATSFYDGRVASLAGIQVSYDGGATWAHPATAVPPVASTCPTLRRTEPSAFGIAIRPDAARNVFIGTNCGLARSTDSGATWTHVVPTAQLPTPSFLQIWDVVAQAGGVIDVCGSDGHHRSTDNGATWTGASTLPGGFCSLAVSPRDPNVLFATRGANVWESDDAGANWFLLDDGIRNRPPFVRTNPTGGGGATTFDVYYSDGVKLRRFACDDAAAPQCPAVNTGNGNVDLGTDLTGGSAHDDASDVEFDSNGCPLYHSSDGGVFINTNCGGGPTWARAQGGMHALWVFGMGGSEIAGPDTAVHFGMQDNGYFSTNDGAANWQGNECCDGFDNLSDADRSLSSICCFDPDGTRVFVGDADDPLSNKSQMTTAPGAVLGFRQLDSFDQFGPESYVQVSSSGVYITTDEGSNWTQLGAASSPVGACGVQASVSLGTPTFYVKTTDCNGGGGRLFKYSGTAPGGTWTGADAGLTAVGVFAVDPGNPSRLRAADLAATPRMVFSNNGGTSWQPDSNLDGLMTAGGAFKYSNSTGPTDFTSFGGYAQPSLVAFDPGNPNVLFAGARDAGVFASTDGGATWGLIADQIPRTFHAFFDPVQDVTYLGSQGRGVWRIALASADLEIAKTDFPDPVNAGEQLFYNLRVTNLGPDDATNVTIVDRLPAQVTFVTDDRGACAEGPVDTLTCSLGTVSSGDTEVLTVKVKVDANTVVLAGRPTGITDTATVSAPGFEDPDPSNNTDSASTIVEELADLAIVKVCKPDGPLPAGQVGHCDILVDNHGPSDARNVVVEDVLVADSPFTIVSVSSSQGACAIAGSTVTCNLGTLAAATTGVPGRATVVVEVTATEETDINDVATVSSLTPDPDTSNNLAQGSISVFAVADLGLTKSDAPDPVLAGSTLNYTLEVSNGGPSTAINVAVKDILPADVAIVSVSATGPSSCLAGVPGDPFLPTTCAFDSLASGDSETMSISVTVLPRALGLLHNDARVSSDTVDTNNANDLASATTQVDAQADLAVTKVDEQDPVIAGEPLDYRLTLVNAGPSDARNVEVIDVLPPGTSFVSATVQDGSGTCVLADPPTNTVRCNIGQVRPNTGTPTFIEIKTRVSSGVLPGTLVNNCSATSTETPDPAGGNNSDAEDTTVITRADLSTDKTSDQDTYQPSSQIVYTVTAFNLGSSDAQNVQVVDSLPDPKKTVYLFDTAGCVHSAALNQLTCDLDTIVANNSKSFNVHVRVKGNTGVLSNTAVASSTTTDPVPGNNADTRQVLVKGGTKEGKGGGTSGTTGMSADISCDSANRRAVTAAFRWTPDPLAGTAPQRLEISYKDTFERGVLLLLEAFAPGTDRAVFNDRLAPGTVYYWRISTFMNGSWVPSKAATFETPFCVADEVEE